MPPVRPQARHLEQLKTLLQRLSAPISIQMQPARGARGRGTTTRGTRGCGVAATSASAAGDTPTGGISKIRWETPNCNQMFALMTYLSTHPADRHILFYKGKKSHPSDDGPPSGSDKGKIHAVIAKHIFKNDKMYQSMYAEDQTKFTQAVGNRLTYLKGKYKTHHARFKQTGAGVNLEEPGTAVNLLAQVLSDFPWYAMIIGDDAPVEDEHVHSAEGHPPANPPPTNPPPANPPPTNNSPINPPPAHDPPTNPPPNFAMGEELDYDEQDVTMQEDQGEVEREEALTIQRSLLNKHPLSSPSPPRTHTHNCPSLGTFKTHTDRAMGRGPMRSPNPPSCIALSSMKTTTCSTSSGLSSPSSSSHLQTTLNDSGAKKSHLGKNIGLEVGSICGKVEMLTNNMSYIYTAKAAASEYKIAKVNALHQEGDLDFQCEKAQLERSEAIVVHQRCQESKTLDLQVLEAQAKVHAEHKAATLQLKIELLKLKGGVAD
ncbi:uncharacterized protein F5147DRAFT_652971 [Suillus discolor]|uniref:Uncharacterized protein n=1 Tax=Suillus discolor TaxID=1912936 RepID=A0A9P7F7B9_9AGAM|nr:uncharacterized protein F5147DRAFT_652971 [Suillus discolor]KAG2108252.1 hypothetical protein F5147DRAFT_652971 [Suillus discolor]